MSIDDPLDTSKRSFLNDLNNLIGIMLFIAIMVAVGQRWFVQKEVYVVDQSPLGMEMYRITEGMAEPMEMTPKTANQIYLATGCVCSGKQSLRGVAP